MTSQPAATPVHRNFVSQMFVMTFNDDGKPIVGDSSCLESTHHLRERNKAVNINSLNSTEVRNLCKKAKPVSVRMVYQAGALRFL